MAKNLQRAVELYTLSHQGGYPDGTYALGKCFEEGRGVKKDAGKARELYRQAAQRGHKRAEEGLKRLEKKKHFWNK